MSELPGFDAFGKICVASTLVERGCLRILRGPEREKAKAKKALEERQKIQVSRERSERLHKGAEALRQARRVGRTKRV